MFRSRIFRWSTRTILIVVTLIATCLAIWTNRATNQRKAVAEIRELYGRVNYDETRWTLGLDRILGHDYFADAVSIDFFHYGYEHPDFEHTVYVEIEQLEEMLPLMKRMPKLQSVKMFYLRQAPWIEKYKLELPHIEYVIVE